jgi:natural product precursor
MKSLKLNVLASENLSKVEMNQVKGGVCCSCSCAYAESGGSSTGDNANANYRLGTESETGDNARTICIEFEIGDASEAGN